MCDYITKKFGHNHLINQVDVGQRKFIGYSVNDNRVFGKPVRDSKSL